MLGNIFASLIDVSWFLNGLEEFKKTVIRNYVVKITSIILIFVLIKDKGDVYKYILVLSFSTILGNLSLLPYLKSNLVKCKINKENIFYHWKKSIVYFIPTIATSIYTMLDKSMIEWITKSSIQNGLYEQSYKISQVTLMVVTSLSIVTLPRVTFLFKEKKYEEINKIMKSTFNFVLLLVFPMCIGLMVMASKVVPWFLGKGFNGCIPILQIFSLLIIFIGLNNTVGRQCLMANNRQDKYNKGVIGGSIVNLILNSILIYYLSAVGAAISSVAAEFTILAIFTYYSRDLIDIKYLLRISVKYIISAVIMGIGVHYFGLFLSGTVGIFIQVLIGVSIYLGCLLLIFKDKYLINFIKSKVIKYKGENNTLKAD